MNEKEIIERLAARVHAQWSGWQDYQNSVAIKGKTTVEFSKGTWDDWNRKASLPYEKLLDHERNSDRMIAKRIWLALFPEVKS